MPRTSTSTPASARWSLDDEELDAAFRWADLVVSTADGDVAAAQQLHARIATADASTVHVVLSGFGLSGPYAAWRDSPLVDWASGGYLYLTGEPDREPLQGGGPWATYLTGATAAIAAQAALIHAARTGEGQLVDVGAMEAVASGHQWSLTMYTHTGAVKGRWGARFGEAHHPMALYRCADGGWICIGAPSRDQWENFCITTDTVELLADEALYAPGVRFERAAEIDAAAAPFLATHTAAQAVEVLQANRVPASRVLDYAEVLACDHLQARDFWAPRDDVAPGARMPGPPFRFADVGPLAAAPALGAHTDDVRAELAAPPARAPLPRIDLSTVRMIEFALAWAGPLAGRWLADLGVDVVKVEHPASRGFASAPPPAEGLAPWTWGEYAPPQIRADVYPDADPGERRWNRMGIFNKMNRNKRSVALDAKAPGGDEVLARLIESADVLVHNFTPRGARSLGIAPEQLAARNDRIASVAMTGYGETGPMSTHSSYGPILEAYGGFDEATGYLDHGPNRVGIALPDAVGGLHGAFALLAALWERETAAAPVHVDLSQLETLLEFAGEALLATSVTGSAPPQHGNRSADDAPQGVYPCAGADRWVAVTVRSDAEWAGLVDLVPALAGFAGATLDERRTCHDEIDAVLTAWTRERQAIDVATLLQARGIPACPAFDNRDLVEDPHLAARGFMVEWDQPDVGRRAFPGFPVHFERLTVELGPTPALGADNDAVVGALGYDAAALAALHAAGTLADRPPP